MPTWLQIVLFGLGMVAIGGGFAMLIITIVDIADGNPPMLVKALTQAFLRCGRGSQKS